MPRGADERDVLARSDPYGHLLLSVVELARRDASKGRQSARRWLADVRAQLEEPPDLPAPTSRHTREGC